MVASGRATHFRATPEELDETMTRDDLIYALQQMALDGHAWHVIKIDNGVRVFLLDALRRKN